MKVFFDVFELAPGAGKSIGIYNYAKNLFLALRLLIQSGGYEGCEWIVACNGANVNDFPSGDGFQVVPYSPGVPGKVNRQLWHCGRAAIAFKRSGADVYFSPKGFLPYGISFLSPATKSVVVVHDLIPFWYRDNLPGYFGCVEEFLVTNGLKRSVCQADHVVAISEYTASDIYKRFGRCRDVAVVKNGVPFVSSSSRVFSGDYLLAVSSSLPHKNSSSLLRGYAKYREASESPVPLVVCGIDDPGVEGVFAVKNVSDSELHGLYAHAKAVVFLSLIEGFGFPPIEAMLHGTPVICSDIPVLREITQNAGVFVNPIDVDAIAEAFSQWRNLDLKFSSAHLRNVANSYTWSGCADGIFSQILAAHQCGS